jgi:hypothetical protein
VKLFTKLNRTLMGTAEVVSSLPSDSFHMQPLGHGYITVVGFQVSDAAACARQTAWFSDNNQVVEGQTTFADITPQAIIKGPSQYTQVIFSTVSDGFMITVAVAAASCMLYSRSR